MTVERIPLSLLELIQAELLRYPISSRRAEISSDMENCNPVELVEQSFVPVGTLFPLSRPIWIGICIVVIRT